MEALNLGQKFVMGIHKNITTNMLPYYANDPM